MRKLKLLLLALFFATIGPILVGGISGLLLPDNSEEYPSRELAYRYYHSILDSYPSLEAKRDEFRDVYTDGFAQKFGKPAECEEHFPVREAARFLARQEYEADELWQGYRDVASVDHGIPLATSVTLETEFDAAAIESLERPAGPLTGSLNGCRQTLLFLACDAIGKSMIETNLAEAEAELQQFKATYASQQQQNVCSILGEYNTQFEQLLPNDE